MTRADALTSIMHYSLFNADPYSITEQFKILADLVEKVPCYRADIGIDSEESVFRLGQLLEETDSERARA